MTSRSRTTTTVRRAAAATTAAVVLVGAGVTAAGAAPPEEDATIRLAPGIQDAQGEVVADGALYFSGSAADGWPSSVYQRALTDDGASVDLGPATLVGRSVPAGAVAEHDGTLAYVRAVDRHLVLRAPDGTSTLPSWGDATGLQGGVGQLTAEWLVGYDNALEPTRTLYHRETGAAYHLMDLVDLPAGFTDRLDTGLAVSEGRALFSVASEAEIDGETQTFNGLYTVALGPDGPEAEPATLAERTQPLDASSSTSSLVVDVAGDRVLWESLSCTGTTCDRTLRWYDGPPYEGTAGSLALGERRVVAVDGDTVVVEHGDPSETMTLEWLELGGDPSEPVVTLDLPGFVHTVEGTLVLWQDRDGHLAWVTDAEGRPVSGDQSDVPAVSPLADLDGQDAFADEALWLYDRGVVEGYTDGTFRNLSSVTREAMAAFLYRAVHGDEAAPACETAPFDDVSTGHPFCGEIAWLADAGVSTGWEDGTFRPGQPVTREAMAAFLYRLANEGDAPSCEEAPFADVTTGHPFCGAIGWMADAGISTGWPDDSFRPGLTIERQAMAAFLFRFIDGGHVPATT